jgi:hypothetical protein
VQERKRTRSAEWAGRFAAACPAPAGSHGAVDGLVVPGDVLAIVNYLNSTGPGPVPANASEGPIFYDTSDDDFVAPNDALVVINFINASGSGPQRGHRRPGQ